MRESIFDLFKYSILYDGDEMKINLRLNLMILAASLLPVIIFFVGISVFAVGYSYAVAGTIISAIIAAFFVSRIVFKGMVDPVSKMSDAVKSFRAAEYKLNKPLPKKGWPESAALISSLNRLMLELSAYRSFQLNQVVEERAKAQALIETISDAILLVDDRGRLIHSNRLAFKILKISGEDHDIVMPTSVGEKAFLPALEEILNSKENYLKTGASVNEPEGDSLIKDFSIMSRQFHMAAFNRPGRVIVIRDVTMEKEIEGARETFFHMITHDMRTPLSSIQGYAELIGKSIHASEVTTKCLNAIHNASQRLNGMIQDILNMIKLEKGIMTLVIEKVDVSIVFARISEMYELLAKRKNIKFSVSLEEDKIFFEGDASLIDRVICNLIGNSLKFTPAGGVLELVCRYEKDDVVFSVKDTGPGIPKERQEDIFGKYSQLDEHKYMGFGLGLAMCKMAVQLHGGKIMVKSEEGKGSEFIFTIPKENKNG